MDDELDYPRKGFRNPIHENCQLTGWPLGFNEQLMSTTYCKIWPKTKFLGQFLMITPHQFSGLIWLAEKINRGSL